MNDTTGVRCQYATGSCRAAATTARERPSGGRWRLCGRHAATIDRIRRVVGEQQPVLDRLAAHDRHGR